MEKTLAWAERVTSDPPLRYAGSVVSIRINTSAGTYGYGPGVWPGAWPEASPLQERCPACQAPAVYDPLRGVLECDRGHSLVDRVQVERATPLPSERPPVAPAPSWAIRPAGKRKLSL